MAGILIDIVNSNKQQSKVVTGIGLNINIPSTVKQQIDQPIIDLVSINKKYQTERNKISAVIIHTLNDYYQHFNHLKYTSITLFLFYLFLYNSQKNLLF